MPDATVDSLPQTLDVDVLDMNPDRLRREAQDWCGGDFREVFVEGVLPHVPRKARVLELGSGAGSWTRAFLQGIPDCTVVAVDRSGVPVPGWSSGWGRRLEQVRQDLSQSLGVPDASADFVFSFGFLCREDASSIEAFLRELRRVARPGAAALVHHGDWAKLERFGWDRGHVPASQKEATGRDLWWPRNDAVTMEATALRCGWTVEVRDLSLLGRDGLMLLRAAGAAPLPSRAASGTSDAVTFLAGLRAELEAGRSETALQTAIRLKAEHRQLPELDFLRARAFHALGRLHEAAESCREELRWNPGHAGAEALLASLPKADHSAGLPDDAEFREIFDHIRGNTMLSVERLWSLFENARRICRDDLPGNFVECGVAAGGSSAMLSWVIARHSRRPRKLFSFDSFEGMPPPAEVDRHAGLDADATGWGTGTCSAPEESLMSLCRRLGTERFVQPVKGLFQDTLPTMRDWVGMVAFLHMDGDWYESTRAILENLYDRVQPNGFVQVDDYGHWEGCRKALHEFEAARGLKFPLRTIDATGVSFDRPDAFPFHPSLSRQELAEFETVDAAVRGIESQMSSNERFQMYYALTHELPLEASILRFVEIGSYAGASLALGCVALSRLGKPVQGISIEPEGTAQFPQVLASLGDAAVHLKAFSHQVTVDLRDLFERDGIRPEYIFVDGDHGYEGVRRDIEEYWPLLAPGGVMLLHDWLPALDERNREFILAHHGGKEPGIRQACEEVLERALGLSPLELPLLRPDDPTQTQAHLPLIPGVFSTVRAYRKPR